MNAQVARVVYIGNYSDLSGLELLEQVGIKVTRMDEKLFKAKLQR